MRHMKPKQRCCDEDERSACYVTPGYTYKRRFIC